jgi:cobalt/nickel transport system ATP-binding protein
MSCSINLRGLNSPLFDNISLDISHKEKIAIVGSNGVGKSTLLDILAGLNESKYDSLEIFHTNIKNQKDYESVREHIGYLFQDSNEQFIAPTVLEDIAFSLRTRGVSEKEAIAKSIEILEKFELQNLQNNSIFELSGGEKKIVALLGILIAKPKLMLLDEPTNGLDNQTQEKLIDILKSTDTSMIIISHQNEFISKIVDKRYLLKTKKLSLIQ